jgi:CRP-like cAMP-binding protein
VLASLCVMEPVASSGKGNNSNALISLRMILDPLFRYIESREHLSDEEKWALERSVGDVINVLAHKDIVAHGATPSSSSLILEGFACGYQVVAGRHRQITALHVMGDFVDLPSLLLKRADHPIAAVTQCRVAVVPHEALLRISDRHPRLARLLWLATLIEASADRRRLAVRRLPAPAHIAHLFCELFVRLKVVGLTRGNSYCLPVTQMILGQAVGLSSVHVNRAVQTLRGAGLINWSGQTVTIPNWTRLCEFAHFNPSYLHVDQLKLADTRTSRAAQRSDS